MHKNKAFLYIKKLNSYVIGTIDIRANIYMTKHCTGTGNNVPGLVPEKVENH